MGGGSTIFQQKPSATATNPGRKGGAIAKRSRQIGFGKWWISGLAIGLRMKRNTLERVRRTIGYPKTIRADQGSEVVIGGTAGMSEHALVLDAD